MDLRVFADGARQTLYNADVNLTTASFNCSINIGNGFPDGLTGNEIPLGARILAPIVDYENLMNGTLAEARPPERTERSSTCRLRRGHCGDP